MQKTRVIMNGVVFGLSAMAIKDHEYETLLATDGDLMFESVTLAELEATYLYGKPLSPAPMYEAITTTSKRVRLTMAGFHRELSRQFAGTELAADLAEIGEPRVAGGFATLTARFPLNDGQSISIIFHSPSGDAAKITESDVLVAFRFLLNRRDVTLAVAPAGGVDVSLKQVTLKLANLAERNSSKFQSTQAKNNAKKSELTTIQNEVETTEKELGEVIEQTETAEAGTLDLVDETKTYTLAVNKANERIKTLKAKLARLQAKSAAKKPVENVSDTPAVADAPSVALTEAGQAELEQFIKSIQRDIKVYELINTGDPSMRGMDAKAFSMSIHNRVKTLHKNGKTGIIDGVLAYLAHTNTGLTKPLFTDRHGIWKLGSGKPIEETAKPVSPTKPVQEKATAEELVYRYYAKLSGNLDERPNDSVNVMKGNQLSAAPEIITMVSAKGLGEVAGVLIYTQKLTDADVAKYGLVDITPDAVQVDDNRKPSIDFKQEVSNLISTHFGKTWHEIGLNDPEALVSIVGGDPRFDSNQRLELLDVVAQYQIDKRIADSQSIFGAGELHWYGLRARPFMMGAAPRAQAVAQLDNKMASVKFPQFKNSNSLRHGAVAYLAPLSQEDIKSYEFIDLAAKGSKLDEDAYEYAMADLIAALLDRYAEGSMRIALDVVESLVQSFKDNAVMFIARIGKAVLAVRDRKEDPETFENFKIFSEQVTAKELEAELMRYVKDAPVVAPDPVVEPEPAIEPDPVVEPDPEISETIDSKVSQHKAPNRIVYHGSAVKVDEYKRGEATNGRLGRGIYFGNESKANVFAKLAKLKGGSAVINKAAIDNTNPYVVTEDSLLLYPQGKYPAENVEAQGYTGIQLVDGGGNIIEETIFDPKNVRSLNELEDPVVAPDPVIEPDPIVEPDPVVEAQAVIEEKASETVSLLEDALVNETDAEALLNILEKAIDDLEQAGAYDENETLVEQVSDRITELLSKEVV
jgi:uncharacterized small protein (DUF1192 family)